MKITSQDIKEMILRELTDLVSTQDDTYGTQRDFEISPFQNYSRVIRETQVKWLKFYKVLTVMIEKHL